MSWPIAAVLITLIAAASFAYWIHRAYDKSPTLHIIRDERQHDGAMN
jgi:hypothetical protein